MQKVRWKEETWRMRGLEEVTIEGDDFNLRITQDPQHHILTIELLAMNDREMVPLRLTKQLDLDRDPCFQILRLRAKDKANGKAKLPTDDRSISNEIGTPEEFENT
ncbi:MAG TPA: hypothetical protein V6C76_11525 [Drouetiella sp.]